jgi:hypothetical protein
MFSISFVVVNFRFIFGNELLKACDSIYLDLRGMR